MSDYRDTNHDGKVSLMEKVKDKLHMGHHNNATGLGSGLGNNSSGLGNNLDNNLGNNSSTLNNAYFPATTALPTTSSYGNTTALPASSYANTTAVPITGAAVPMTGAAVMPMATAVPVVGMQQGAYDSRDLNRDGHVSIGEKLASNNGRSGYSTGAFDSRDLNRDGHVSIGEKLASGSSGSAYNTGAYDSRDLNRDGHISTGERLAGSAMNEEARLKLHEEQLAISKREVGAGQVEVQKRVHEQHVEQTIPVKREELILERRPLSGIPEPGAQIAPQDESLRVELFREELVTEKRVVPTEEVIVRKKEVVDQQTVGANLLSEHLETMQNSGMYDARDTNRDGHVSLGERIKGDTIGNNSLNTGAFGNNLNNGAYDARDTNRDGHVSLGERIKGDTIGTNNLNTGAYDARDTNRDGHVSMGEKIKGNALGTAPKAARG